MHAQIQRRAGLVVSQRSSRGRVLKPVDYSEGVCLVMGVSGLKGRVEMTTSGGARSAQWGMMEFARGGKRQVEREG